MEAELQSYRYYSAHLHTSKFQQMTVNNKIQSVHEAILKVMASHVRYVLGLDLIQSISAPIWTNALAQVATNDSQCKPGSALTGDYVCYSLFSASETKNNKLQSFH